jgi:hypothetical protein
VGGFEISFNIYTDSIYFLNPLATIEDKTSVNFHIYPNPANSEIIIFSPRNIINSMRIFDISGNLITSRKINSNETKIDLSSLENGIYFICCHTENGLIREKIVVSR